MKQHQQSSHTKDRQVYAGEVIESIPARRSINALLATQPGSIMLQSAMLEAGHDKCRAMMAQSILEHTGTLSVLAARMSAIAPQSSEHYAAIIDAYARKAARQLERM